MTQPAAGKDAAFPVSEALGLPERQVRQALQLLDGGNTIPFVARYRKEATGGLDEVELRAIAAGAEKYRALEERKAEVLRLIGDQGKLVPELEEAILNATNLQGVEDLYRPFRPKRRTRASVARDLGLEPLAEELLERHASWSRAERLATEAALRAKLAGAPQALEGASDIIAERVAEDPVTRGRVRDIVQKRGTMTSECALTEERAVERTPYEAYYGFTRPVRELRPHAVLAIDRGEREGILKVSLEVPEEAVMAQLTRLWVHATDSDVASFLARALRDSYTRLLRPSIERELRRQLAESAGEHAIGVFARNLESLLLQPPVREARVLGVDPGFRTGCKLAVIDETGRLLESATIYPHPPHNRVGEAEELLRRLITRHQVSLVAIGNGTAARETEVMIARVIGLLAGVQYTIVSEAGASVYSASDLARSELPGIDVSLRGAVSIARRLQDPLAELVKIEPKSIGVGQYQHDVDQKALVQSLAAVVESCVNRVGVNLNTASAALLQYVAGLTATLGRRLVAYRDEQGPFQTREELLKVKGVGPKTFEQAAGFLRIPGGAEALDATAVHPESYSLAAQILGLAGLSPDSLGAEGGMRSLQSLDSEKVATDLGAGVPTVTDIIEALLRPGLDPRTELPPPPFRRDVVHIDSLRPGMRLRGTVSNVVDFGVFVDLGLHKAGLIHVSKLSTGYVRHPLDVVAVGEAVEVEVLSVDIERERIALALVPGLS